jgi:hypothetical protein
LRLKLARSVNRTSPVKVFETAKKTPNLKVKTVKPVSKESVKAAKKAAKTAKKSTSRTTKVKSKTTKKTSRSTEKA